jgi:hypothetical protein
MPNAPKHNRHALLRLRRLDGPNASIDRHSPGGAIMGGQAVEDHVGPMDHLQGCVRGRMLRLGQMTLMFFAATRGAIDSKGNESAKRTDE